MTVSLRPTRTVRQTLGERANGRDNHFDFIRVVAAMAVLVSHAWPLSYGRGWSEPLSQFLPGYSLGRIALLAFFAISGFFIARSFDRSRSAPRFLVARALRLFPALGFMLVLTVLVAAAFSERPSAIWAEAGSYLLRNLSLVSLRQELPGIFDAAPFGPTINGSLWTLIYEVVCYLSLLLFGIAGGFDRPRIAWVAAISFLAIAALGPLIVEQSRLLRLFDLGLPFAIGAGLYMCRHRIPQSGAIALLGLGGALLLRNTTAFPMIFAASWSYAIIVAGFASFKFLDGYRKLGDYSYGIYIYAFPIQQAAAVLGFDTPATNIAFSLPITLGCAVLSWHLLERPALALKNAKGHIRPEGRSKIVTAMRDQSEVG